MKRARNNYVIVLFVLVLIAALVLRNIYLSTGHYHGHSTGATFNRTMPLVLSLHARCRMDCRHITEEDIKEIIHDGNINYTKSDPDNERGPTYALEGYGPQHEHLRVVVAPESSHLVVVTCIDLDKEWQCNCN